MPLVYAAIKWIVGLSNCCDNCSREQSTPIVPSPRCWGPHDLRIVSGWNRPLSSHTLADTKWPPHVFRALFNRNSTRWDEFFSPSIFACVTIAIYERHWISENISISSRKLERYVILDRYPICTENFNQMIFRGTYFGRYFDQSILHVLLSALNTYSTQFACIWVVCVVAYIFIWCQCPTKPSFSPFHVFDATYFHTACTYFHAYVLYAIFYSLQMSRLK